MPVCRFCQRDLGDVVLDLGTSPLANSYLLASQLVEMEPYYPLKTYFCGNCGLVQLEEYVAPDGIFSDYDYFSSYSAVMLDHAQTYVQHMMDDFGIDPSRQVVEIASNDGYLLQFFVKSGIPALGVEPAANVAKAAVDRGVPTKVAFFSLNTARKLKKEGVAADLLLGNNVLAHVPDINNFVAGMAFLLKDNGIVTVEFPHLLNMIRETQFDTIYHEHFSYLSLATVVAIFAAHGLRVFRTEKVTVHGGSLRVFACLDGADRDRDPSVDAVLAEEHDARLNELSGYAGFSESAFSIKLSLLEFLIDVRKKGKKIAAYGAAAKGNTLLNYAGVKSDLLPMVADRSPHKQGKFLPGSRVPIVAPEALLAYRPDYVLVLPWNLRDEIAYQLDEIRGWGGRFVSFIPAFTQY